MNLVTHELVLVEHTGREDVALRSHVPAPQTVQGYASDIVSVQEDYLPPEMSEYLRRMMGYHEEKLAKEVGYKWIEGS